MPTQPNPPDEAAGQRRRAEARLRELHPEWAPDRTDADTQRLVHELQVHQIELEMQNDELQQARTEMETALEKYSDLYDFAPVGYLTLDRDGTIQEANLTAASLLGMERSRLIQRRFSLRVAAADLPAFTAFLARVFASKARESCEVRLFKEGKCPVAVRIEATVAASGRECRAVLEDITRHKQAEQDRLVLNKLESTGILAGGLAHDFNNLLTTILLSLSLAQESVPAGEDLARQLEEAKKATLTARGLTRQLITFATGGAPVPKPTRLSGVIQDSVRSALSGSPVRPDFSLAEDLWLAEVDAGQIEQVIRNLVLNAREVMPQGGVVSVRAENVALGAQNRPALPAGSYVRVSIADQGGGIGPEVLPRIFDPYFSTKQRGDQKGMGLGLTICHTIIQKHGGAIAVESVPGVGTTFHLHLPASQKAPAEAKTTLPQQVLRKGRILVMDDEEAVRRVVGLTLWGMGLAVELAEDGKKAVEVYSSAKNQGRPFDAVLLDLTVRGGMGGQETVQALREIDPAVKAIVMSGYTDDPVLREPARYGFAAALEKPFEIGKLQELLCTFLGGSPKRRVTS